ncbi:MAG: alpha/beta hydrolase [Sphingomonadales bacterium]|nr:alpha/beta hydrolase [Sphingomonadales bacterium]
MPRVQTKDGTSLFVKTWGEGRPVVLIHGWPLSADSWDPVALALAENGFRAIAYDRRGFGRSDQPWQGYDYDTFADDLAEVMEQTGAYEDVALVGFSMGGGEVARHLSRHGGRGVSRVALVSSVVPLLAKGDDNPDGVPASVFDEMAAEMRKDRAAFFRTFFDGFFGMGLVSRPVSGEQIDQAWATAMMAGLHPTLAAAQAFASTDFRHDLAAFRVPTLVIHGTADKTVPIDPTGRAVARAVPGARLIAYDGEPHGLFATATDRLIGDLLGFLGEDAGGAAVLAGLEAADPELRQDLIDEITRESVITPKL